MPPVDLGDASSHLLHRGQLRVRALSRSLSQPGEALQDGRGRRLGHQGPGADNLTVAPHIRGHHIETSRHSVQQGVAQVLPG